jgi:hypothetical protein
MKRIILAGALAIVAALAAAQTAQAKGYISAIRVCGPSGCATADAPRSAKWRFGMDMYTDAGPAAETPPILPYYRLQIEPRYEMASDTFYIPGANVICADGGCTRVRKGLSPALSAAAASVDAFTPHIRSVTVNNTPRADSQAYAVLFNERPAASPPNTVWTSRSYAIEVRFTRLTPWSLGGVSWMAYYPRYNVLTRDGAWFHGGEPVGRLVLGQTTTAGGGGHGWPMAAAAVVVIAAAAGAGKRLRRPGAA